MLSHADFSAVPAPCFHELYGAAQVPPNAALAPSWQRLLAIENLHAAGLDERLHHLRQHLRDDDVSFSVFGSEGVVQRPWSLDLLPIPLDTHDWQCVSQGALQYTQLFDRVLADVHGAQTVLQQGLLPPALVQGHPGYVPAMQGVQLASGRHLHVAALDMARDAQGYWWLVSHRLQRPSGLGYLLENRQLIAQQFPLAFEQMHVQRLAAAYQKMLASLRWQSGAGHAAHVALLTEGVRDKTWFEHAYLARQLGVSLVEGSDLTVRNSRLYLKTLHGLEQVHVLLKQVNDANLDPLELQPDSFAGVPGLMQVVRSGHVLMANAPGSGFLESAGVLGFLPGLAQHFLGETLHVPPLPTWWCGEAAVLPQVLDMLDDCVIKRTYPHHRLPQAPIFPLQQPVITRYLTPEERAQWAQRLQQDGRNYTVQQHVNASCMPVWRHQAHGQGQLQGCSGLVRVFCVSDGVDGWSVLPGGMARLAEHGSGLSDMRWGGSSADVWVLGDAPVVAEQPFLQPQRAPGQPAFMRGWVVTSTAADNLFWLGRYTERIENCATLVLTTLALLNGEKTPSAATLQWLDGLLRWQGLLHDDAPHLHEDSLACKRQLLDGLCGKHANAQMRNNLTGLVGIASRVRDRLAGQQWQEIRLAHDEWAHEAARLAGHTRLNTDSVQRMVQRLMHRLAAITGSQLDRMTRDDGWMLLSAGRLLERTAFLSHTLAQSFSTQAVHDDVGFHTTLALFDSTITYHAWYQHSRDLADLLHLLVYNGDNPRALGWLGTTLLRRVRRLQSGSKTPHAVDLTHFIPLADTVDLATLCQPNDQGQYPHVQALLQRYSEGMQQLGSHLAQRFFTHAGVHMHDTVRSPREGKA